MRVPASDLTRPLGGGKRRYHCPGEAITAMAREVATAQARRVETVLRAHLNLAHPRYLKDQHP